MTVDIKYLWTGTAWQPLERFAELCRNSFGAGQIEKLEPTRSRKSHNHQFAEVEEFWHHAPEYVVEALPSPEHLRKHALCVAGYCDIEKFVFETKADATRAAMMARPRMQNALDYVVVQVTGNVLTRYTPHSQSVKAMGRKDFQASKDAVLQVCARMLGGTLEQLRNSPSITPSYDQEDEREEQSA